LIKNFFNDSASQFLLSLMRHLSEGN
jgi:hypothetical protein